MRLSKKTLLAVGAVLLLASCGGGAATGNEVSMLDNTFRPDKIEVVAGTELVFVNEGRSPHNVIAEDGSFDSRDTIGGNHESGESWAIAINDPGTYPYYCSLHAVQKDDGSWKGMVGTLIVKAEGTP